MASLIVYGIVGLFLLGGGLAWYHTIKSGAVTAYKAQVEEQEKVIAAKDAKAEQEAAKKITDMQSEFQRGQAQAVVVEKKIYLRAQGDVARYPVFQNPQCVLPAESLALLNAARSGLRSGTVPDAILSPAVQTVPSGGEQGTTSPPRPIAPASDPPASEPRLPGKSAAPQVGATLHPKPVPLKR